MDLERALRTTGAVRDFASDAVPDEVLHGILDTARFAPSGGNRQAWRVIIVKDPDARRRLRDLYLVGWYQYLAIRAGELVPWAPITDRDAERDALQHAEQIATEAAQGPGGFAEHLDEVPVLLVLAADLSAFSAVDRDFDRYTFVGGASLYPFAWSILLAAHEAGLGGVITTMPVREEARVRDLLGLPSHYAIATVLALGYPAGGKRPTRLQRNPVEGFTTVDRFDGTPFAAGDRRQ